jgi:hypothetical protein
MAKKEQPAASAQSVDLQQQEMPSLNLQDLILIAQIIQVSSTRGAFRAEELANVGNLYTKLVAFLQSTGALVPATDTVQPEEN